MTLAPILPQPAMQLTETLSVGQLFSLDTDQSLMGVKSSLQVAELADLRKSVPRLVSWTSVQSAVAGSLQTALGTPLIDVFADAWKLFDTVRQEVKESIKSPQSRTVLPLAEHEINSTLHPKVDVLVGTAVVRELIFDVTLTATIQGLLLTLQNGSITALELGTSSCLGKVAIHEIEVLKRDLFTLKLPGELRLHKPIPLSTAPRTQT